MLWTRRPPNSDHKPRSPLRGIAHMTPYTGSFPITKKSPAKPIILDSAGIVPCSSAGLFLVHELLEGNPVLDCDLVAFLNINPFNQSADDHMPDSFSIRELMLDSLS